MSTCPLDANDYRLFGGRMGDGILQVHVTQALAITWSEVERYLQSNVVPATGTYTCVWPSDNIVPLNNFYIRGIVGVTGFHDNLTCDCSLRSYPENAVVIEPRQGIISVRSCHGGWNGCASCTSALAPLPFLCQVDYVSGIWDDKSSIPPDVMMAIVLLARWESKQLSGQEDLGAPEVQSFSNLGYTETRTPPKDTYFGTSYAAQRAEKVLRHYRVKRMIRNRPTTSASIIGGFGGNGQSGQPTSWRM